MERSAPDSSDQRWRRFAIFARNFARNPLSVGTFAPSSPYLVKRVLAQANWASADVVVEYGPGLGTISAGILERLKHDARLLLIETNPEFVEYLQDMFIDRRVIVELASAGDVAHLLAMHGLPRADVVVSGIPFSTIPPDVRRQILAETARSLKDDGRFIIYQYTRAVLKHLDGHFHVAHQSTEWRNTWPAQVFDCRKDAVMA